LLGGNLPHYWHTHGESAGISIQWHFPPVHPLWALPEMASVQPAAHQALKGVRFGGGTAERVGELLHAMTTAGAPSRLAKLLEILSLITSAPPAEAAVLSTRTFGLSSGSRHQAAIDAVVRHLIAHFREEIRLPALLRLSRMSRATFARQFKEHSGRTVSEFVNELRLQAACRALLGTDRSVLEIALDCGFSQVSFFNRLFRREMGCSPREYRSAAD
jgi:AraC-like DNA-binding protein